MSLTERISNELTRPVSTAALVYFRVCFAGLLLMEGLRYWFKGSAHNFWIDPEMHFRYELFWWLPDFSPAVTTALYVLMGVLLICIILGFFFRISSILFCFLFSYFFFIDKTPYMNHFYLFVLLSFLMCFLPANKLWSLDVKQGRQKKSSFVPGWTVWLLRFQLAVVFFYGGIAKLNMDWLRGQPMGVWLSKKGSYPIIGPYVDEKWLAYFFSYGGLALDLLVVPFLLFKKTRWWAIGFAFLFHFMNSRLFSIGIFPYVMVVLTFLFFPPESFRKLGQKYFSGFKLPKKPRTKAFGIKPLTKLLLGGYVVIHLLMPFRHFLFSGDPSWTEEGHFFSWRMMLRDKTTSGTIDIKDVQTGKLLNSIRFTDYLTNSQNNMMLRRPDMIRQFNHHIRDVFEEKGTYGDFEISSIFMASFNGRDRQLLLDPEVDLSKQKFSWGTSPWIMPMKTPFEGPAPPEVLPKSTKSKIDELIKQSTTQPQLKINN